MSDDKSKVGKPDRSKINPHERYEVYDTAKNLQAGHPRVPLQKVEQLVVEMAKIPQFHSNRKMIENAVKMKLVNL